MIEAKDSELLAALRKNATLAEELTHLRQQQQQQQQAAAQLQHAAATASSGMGAGGGGDGWGSFAISSSGGNLVGLNAPPSEVGSDKYFDPPGATALSQRGGSFASTPTIRGTLHGVHSMYSMASVSEPGMQVCGHSLFTVLPLGWVRFFGLRCCSLLCAD